MTSTHAGESRHATKDAAQIAARHVRMIGCPMDLGADRRGVDMGPSAIRYAGISARVRAIGHQFSDAGTCRCRFPRSARRGRVLSI